MDVRSIFHPQKGTTLPGEIGCYGLPYGALGFISHLLTYYTIGALACGRRPLMPWKKLSHGKTDLAFGIISLVGGFALTIFTILRCRNSTELLLIGIWKMSMSLLNGLVGIHISFLVRRFDKKKANENQLELVGSQSDDPANETPSREQTENQGPKNLDEPANETPSREQTGDQGPKNLIWALLWIILYIPGMIAGILGLISVIVDAGGWSDKRVRLLTQVFGGVAAFVVLGLILASFYGRKFSCIDICDAIFDACLLWLILAALAVVTVLSAFFCDWTLGLLAGNLLGTPDSDVSEFYWAYYVLKRFTMFSF